MYIDDSSKSRHKFDGLQRGKHPIDQPVDKLWDAHNIRLTDRDGESLFALTNEKSTRELLTFKVEGATCYCLGYAIIDDQLIVFCHYESTEDAEETTTYSVTVNKVDEDGNYLQGASLKILYASTGKVVSGKTWESTGASDTITGLAAGTYILRESSAPDGYTSAEDIEFTIDDEGNITVDGETVDSLTMVNAAESSSDSGTSGSYSINIRKWDPENSTYVSGCVLVIYDSDGEVAVDEWTTTSNYSTVTLENGTYTLHEISAADGYNTADDVEFTVRNGKVIQNGTSSSHVQMNNYTGYSIAIYKYIYGTDTPLAGATLTITDADGNTVDTYTTTGEDGEVWKVSGLEEYVIYTLSETEAPDGYEAAESIMFTWYDRTLYIVTENEDYTGDDDSEEEEYIYTEADSIVLYNKTGAIGLGFICTDQTTNEAIAGAQLTVESSDGSISHSWTSAAAIYGEDGFVSFSDFTEGTYTITETSAPDGYDTFKSLTFEVARDEDSGSLEVEVNEDRTDDVGWVAVSGDDNVSGCLILMHSPSERCEVTLTLDAVNVYSSDGATGDYLEDGDSVEISLAVLDSNGRSDQIGSVSYTYYTSGAEQSEAATATSSSYVTGYEITFSGSVKYAKNIYISNITCSGTESDGTTFSESDTTGYNVGTTEFANVFNECSSLNVGITVYIEIAEDQ